MVYPQTHRVEDTTQGKVCQAGSPKGSNLTDWCAEAGKLINIKLNANLLVISTGRISLKGTNSGDHFGRLFFA